MTHYTKKTLNNSSLILLCFFVLLSTLSLPTNRTAFANDEPTELKFDESGNFKIMVISDIQDGANVSSYTIDLITTALQQDTPDLVVLNGDNIFGLSPSLVLGGDNIKKSIDTFMRPIIERNIPFTFVFGNHDVETLMSKNEQLEYYQTLPNNLTKSETIGSRVGNHNLLVANHSGKPVLNLWFIDSGWMTITEHGIGYDYVTPEQIEWYKKTSNELRRQNDGIVIPSVVFQHIPVPEIYSLLTEVDKDTAGAIEGFGIHAGHYYVLDESKTVGGTMNEAPCPPDHNSGEFEAWVEQGDVFAAVFGHDHVNDFSGNLYGIDMMYAPGVGFYSYGNGYHHGIRVLDFTESDIKNYSTRVLYWDDLTNKDIPNDILYSGSFVHGDLFIYVVIVVTIIGGVLFLVIFTIIRIVRKGLRRRNGNNSASTE